MIQLKILRILFKWIIQKNVCHYVNEHIQNQICFIFQRKLKKNTEFTCKFLYMIWNIFCVLMLCRVWFNFGVLLRNFAKTFLACCFILFLLTFFVFLFIYIVQVLWWYKTRWYKIVYNIDKIVCNTYNT